MGYRVFNMEANAKQPSTAFGCARFPVNLTPAFPAPYAFDHTNPSCIFQCARMSTRPIGHSAPCRLAVPVEISGYAVIRANSAFRNLTFSLYSALFSRAAIFAFISVTRAGSDIFILRICLSTVSRLPIESNKKPRHRCLNLERGFSPWGEADLMR